MTAIDDAAVHVLTMSVAFGEREIAISPVAIETDRGLLLVDVGPEGAVDALEAHLADLGFGLSDLRLVVLTHHDSDHAGGLAELRDRADVAVAAHREEAPYVVGDRHPIKSAGDRYPPAHVDVEVVGGVRFATAAGPLEVVETPGHAPGHVSLHLPERTLLIAGDALVADGGEGLSGPKPEFTPDMARAGESVDDLAALDVDRVVCFHGGYVDEGADRIRRIADELRE